MRAYVFNFNLRTIRIFTKIKTKWTILRIILEIYFIVSQNDWQIEKRNIRFLIIIFNLLLYTELSIHCLVIIWCETILCRKNYLFRWFDLFLFNLIIFFSLTFLNHFIQLALSPSTCLIWIWLIFFIHLRQSLNRRLLWFNFQNFFII